MKKIKQWFMGLLFAIYGVAIIGCFVGVVVNFISMMNTTGKEFVGYFLGFIFMLGFSMFMPYVFFKQIQDGVKDKYK